jgi:hypothetical protein
MVRRRLGVRSRLAPWFNSNHSTAIAAKPHPKSAYQLQGTVGVSAGSPKGPNRSGHT